MDLTQFKQAVASVALAVLVGHVTDATTGQPLTNVTIAIGSHKTTTDAHGDYRLGGLAPGPYTVTASSKDVPLQHRGVNVKQSTQTLNLVLCSTTLDYSCAGTGAGPGPG
jgi:protocatechuate 3,4-dioxygenase beta subunit